MNSKDILDRVQTLISLDINAWLVHGYAGNRVLIFRTFGPEVNELTISGNCQQICGKLDLIIESQRQ